MVCLRSISDYVRQTANIIGGALELDVLIIDHEQRIIGDSELASIPEERFVGKNSILTNVISERKKMIFFSNDEYEGCRNCYRKSECTVAMIIAIPIFFEGNVVGSLGLVANSPSEKEKIINNKENYLKFIDRMIELISNKLRQEKEFAENSLLKKRMEVVLDSIDHFLILVSNEGDILQTNINFKKIFKKELPKKLKDFLDQGLVEQILHNSEEIKFREVKIDNKHEFLFSSKPVILGRKEQGAVLTFRSIKDLAVEMNELYTHSMDVVYDDFIGESKEINEIKEKIRHISGSSSTVLIDGETGTGKEVVARLIHNTSKRKNCPFVAINCAAIPEELMESELFGYEEGAFSGAKKGGKIGKFQLADGGTIFLDEIGEMGLHLQAKLLRVIQEKVITKIGGLEPRDIDIRIIAATNRKLEDLVAKGMFREDLYYRIKVIPITIPPLRERKGDLELLLNDFIKIYSNRMGKKVDGISENAKKFLLNYNWPGNVRELKNIIEFSINMTNSNIIKLNNLPEHIFIPVENKLESYNIEKNTNFLMKEVLRKYGDTTQGKKIAAEALGISLATLYRKLEKIDVS